jgi:hypothetical protein
MKANLLCLSAVAVMLALTGCNQAKSPDEVSKDVAKATASAEKADDKAAEKEAKADEKATNGLANDLDKASGKEINAAADDAVTQAEGDRKIALAKCEALAGDAQKACKDQADAEYKQVKERAKDLKKSN